MGRHEVFGAGVNTEDMAPDHDHGPTYMRHVDLYQRQGEVGTQRLLVFLVVFNGHLGQLFVLGDTEILGGPYIKGIPLPRIPINGAPGRDS